MLTGTVRIKHSEQFVSLASTSLIPKLPRYTNFACGLTSFIDRTCQLPSVEPNQHTLAPTLMSLWVFSTLLTAYARSCLFLIAQLNSLIEFSIAYGLAHFQTWLF